MNRNSSSHSHRDTETHNYLLVLCVRLECRIWPWLQLEVELDIVWRAPMPSRAGAAQSACMTSTRPSPRLELGDFSTFFGRRRELPLTPLSSLKGQESEQINFFICRVHSSHFALSQPHAPQARTRTVARNSARWRHRERAYCFYCRCCPTADSLNFNLQTIAKSLLLNGAPTKKKQFSTVPAGWRKRCRRHLRRRRCRLIADAFWYCKSERGRWQVDFSRSCPLHYRLDYHLNHLNIHKHLLYTQRIQSSPKLNLSPLENSMTT